MKEGVREVNTGLSSLGLDQNPSRRGKHHIDEHKYDSFYKNSLRFNCKAY